MTPPDSAAEAAERVAAWATKFGPEVRCPVGVGPDPADLRALLAELATAKAENEQLRLEICGGEDAPGYAASLPLEAILGVLRQNYGSWSARIAEAEARADQLQRDLAAAREGLRPFARMAEILEKRAILNFGKSVKDDAVICESGGEVGTATLKMGHFRRAAALLAPQAAPEQDGAG